MNREEGSRMDGKYARGLTALWLWNELGELCRLLAWPVWGGAANYCFFFLLAGNRNGLPTLGSVFAATCIPFLMRRPRPAGCRTPTARASPPGRC